MNSSLKGLRRIIRQAVGDPGAFAGRRLGPSWPESSPHWRAEPERLIDWQERAVWRVIQADLTPEWIYVLEWPEEEGEGAHMKLYRASAAHGFWAGQRLYVDQTAACAAGIAGYLDHEQALTRDGHYTGIAGYDRAAEQGRLWWRVTDDPHIDELWYGFDAARAGGPFEGGHPTGIRTRKVRLNRRPLHEEAVADEPR